MRCDTYTEKLYLYAAGELSGRQQADCERHLEQCAACRQTLEGYQEVIHMYHQVSAPALTITAANILEQAKQPKTRQIGVFWRTPGVWAPVAGVLVFVVISVLLILSWPRIPQPEIGFSDSGGEGIFQPAHFVLETRRSTESVLEITFPPPERLKSLASEISKLRYSGIAHSTGFRFGNIQRSDIIRRKIEGLRADDIFS